MANTPEIQILTDLLLDTKKDVSEIKEMTIKNATVLDEHQRRSVASENRIERLETKDQMITGFVKITIAIVGLAGTIVAIVAAIRSL